MLSSLLRQIPLRLRLLGRVRRGIASRERVSFDVMTLRWMEVGVIDRVISVEPTSFDGGGGSVVDGLRMIELLGGRRSGDGCVVVLGR